MSAPLDVLARVEAAWGRESPEYVAVAELVEAARKVVDAAAMDQRITDTSETWMVTAKMRDSLAKFGGAVNRS